MKRPLASRLDRLIRIERPESDNSFTGAGSGNWALVADKVPAEVKDVLAGRSERSDGGINVATRSARVSIRWRGGITPDMRFVMGATIVDGDVDYSAARIMQIVGGPFEIGRREELQFAVEDYSTAGNGA